MHRVREMSGSMTPIHARARGSDSAHTLWITGCIAAGAIGVGLAVAQLELLPILVLAALLAFAAILHDPRRGLVLLAILVPLSGSTRMPHQLLGVTGLNPLNLTLMPTLAGLFLSTLFPGIRRPLTLKQLPLPAALLMLMVVPMVLAAGHGSFSVDLIPTSLRRMGDISFSDAGGYLRDVLIAPLLWVLAGQLLGLVLRQDGPVSASRVYLYAPLVGVCVLAVMFLVNAFTSLGSLHAMADQDARNALAAAAGMHPNEVSLMFNCGLAWALFTARDAPLSNRLALAAVAALMSVATLLTFSRGGFIGMLVVLAAYTLEMRRFRLIAAAAVVLAVGAMCLPEAVIGRLTTGLAQDDLNAVSAGRATMIWPLLLPMIEDHWLLGGGMESILWSAPVRSGALPVAQPHCAYLGVLLDYGVVGAVMILSFHLWCWFALHTLARRLQDGALAGADRVWARFVQATSVMVPVLMVQSVTDNRLTPTPSQTLMWLAIGLAFGLRARCRDQAVRA
jgi:O-antigen ligase